MGSFGAWRRSDDVVRDDVVCDDVVVKLKNAFLWLERSQVCSWFIFDAWYISNIYVLRKKSEKFQLVDLSDAQVRSTKNIFVVFVRY